MAKRKLKTFTSTCQKDYDRHTYKVVLKDGQSVILDDYEKTRAFWYQFREQLDCVEVLG